MWGTSVYLLPIHVVVKQKRTQQCKVIILQIKINEKKTKNVLLSTGNYIQYLVAIYNGKEFENEYIYIYIWASWVVLVVKNLPVNSGDIRHVGSVLGPERSPGGGHGNQLQYSCLENPMDSGVWQATVHRVAKSWT